MTRDPLKWKQAADLLRLAADNMEKGQFERSGYLQVKSAKILGVTSRDVRRSIEFVGQVLDEAEA